MSTDDTIEVRIAAATWDEMSSLVHQEFVSDWLQVSEDRVRAFEASSFVDSNPNAVNENLYPSGLVEGFHALSLLDYLSNQVSFVVDPRWSGWNYGLDKVRFVSVITTSDRVRLRGHIESITPRGDNALVLYHCVLEVEGREKPGLVAEWRVLWTRIDEAGSR